MSPESSDITIRLLRPQLIVLAGGSGAGKSRFAERFFLPTQIVSTDRCRALVGDREDVQAYSKQAFELFYFLIEKRMELSKVIVADSTALQTSVRHNLLELARRHYYPTTLIVLSAGLEVRRERNLLRERQVADDVLVQHEAALERTLQEIGQEGWDRVYVLSPEEAARANIILQNPNVYSSVPPPYDFVGDVHGCYGELTELLAKLGWRHDGESYVHPEGRTLVSIGDLADRGPEVPQVFDLFVEMAQAGRALFVPGNHDNKLLRYLIGRRVRVAHGLEDSIAELEALPASERQRLEDAIIQLVGNAPPYLILDQRQVVAAHAGIKKEMIGKVSRQIVEFTLYGDVTGRTTPEGLPERLDWAGSYTGQPLVVYGHTPVPEPVIRNHTVNIDQGCVFGGKLTALRYPELEFVQVPARRVYYSRPSRVLDVDEPGTEAG